MAKCLECIHWKPCYSGKEWDAAIGTPCEHFSTIDAVEVVRCENCIHSEPFERNCKLNSSAYMHCKILRGEEVKNVWHKYKKYYRDYSVVDRDGFCDEGERRKEDAAD